MIRILVFTVSIPLMVLGVVYFLYPEKMFNSDRKVIRRRLHGEKPELNSEWILIAKRKGIIFFAVGLLFSPIFWFLG